METGRTSTSVVLSIGPIHTKSKNRFFFSQNAACCYQSDHGSEMTCAPENHDVNNRLVVVNVMDIVPDHELNHDQSSYRYYRKQTQAHAGVRDLEHVEDLMEALLSLSSRYQEYVAIMDVLLIEIVCYLLPNSCVIMEV